MPSAPAVQSLHRRTCSNFSRNAPKVGASAGDGLPALMMADQKGKNMKNLSECKEYYKDLYMNCLENDSFEKSIFESTEKARYETFCETLKFIYDEDFKNIMPNWSSDASKEFYSRK